VALQADLAGKKIVRLKGGRAHFVAYERTQELSSLWSTEEVVKFAQREGLEDFIKIFQSEKVTGKVLLEMDKKYMEEVLGINNVKMQQKLSIRLQESNVENPDAYVIHGWGRASEGALGTNPSKEITKPIKIKLPADCEIVDLTGSYTVIANRKLGLTFVNSIDEKTNKQEWKEVCNKQVWSASAVDDALLFIVSASKERLPQRESEAVLNVKKEKLRTAKNIIDKITWDPNIKAEDFRVGFLDKLEGVLEMPFSEL
jgi:asparagine synthetase B (glutamine-hydrolysing)